MGESRLAMLSSHGDVWMTWAIQRQSPRAVYDQIADVLTEEIRVRHNVGERLASEQVLAERFAVNRHTIRHAIDMLVGLGLVERRHGLGTFVLDRPFDYPVSSRTRFTENLLAQGKASDSRLLRRAIIPATSEIAQALKLESNADVVWIETLRIVDGRPMSLIAHHLPASRFRDLMRIYDGGSLHDCLEHEFGIAPLRQRSVIGAQAPTDGDASLLLIPRTTPVLRICAVNADSAGQPVEYSIGRMRADRVQLSIDHKTL
jgi:GntR family transcriptional regulator, phosphonate transport system regulatory protein